MMIDETTKDQIRENMKNPRLIIEQIGRKAQKTGVNDALRYMKQGENI